MPSAQHCWRMPAPTGERLGLQHESQDHLPRMAENPSGHLPQFPPHRGDRLRRPRGGTGQAFKTHEEVVRQHPDPEKDRIRPRLAARQLLQPQPVREFFVEILGLAARRVPA